MKHETSTETQATVHYDSNPFTAAWSGIRKLIHTNGQTTIGVSFFNILLFTLTIFTVGVLALSVVAYAFKHVSGVDDQFDASIADFMNSLSDTSIYATWIIGVVLCVFLSALTQSIQLNLTVAAARSVSIKFGALLKASVRTTLPILGFIGLVMLAVLAVAVIIAALSLVLGMITFIVGMLAVIGLIYVGIRLSYTTYAIVDLHLSPVEAAKHSWKISRDHLIETVGATAVTGLILTVPSIVMQALIAVSQNVPVLTGIFGILDMVLVLVLIIIAGMSVAERYVQLQAVSTGQATATKLSPFNYLAIAGFVVLGMLSNALTPADPNSDDPFRDLMKTSAPAETSDDTIYRTN